MATLPSPSTARAPGHKWNFKEIKGLYSGLKVSLSQETVKIVEL